MTGVRIQTEQLHCAPPPIFHLQCTLKMIYGLKLIYQVQYTPEVLFERQSTVTMEMNRRLCLSLLTIKKKKKKQKTTYSPIFTDDGSVTVTNDEM